ncbi:SDR family oxidoreductase [Chryseolinea sp. H1M3-3]|uniref:SDR family oxidoreductase n=1 Tax=Chryseolinea sp. H1M3-3 TaxID=3034144 RepID=UPI0023EBB09A|nr:SDR family oxidoreductase [Chryseolinea sp. H1M3-3]
METTTVKMPKKIPPQEQDQQPGIEQEMNPKPIYDNDEPGLGRLKGKVAIITGGDSGIGRAVAVQFAKEGADVVIAYLNEHGDAKETASEIRKYGKEPLLIPIDVSEEKNCETIVEKTLEKFSKIDIVVNNAAVQYEQHSIEDISAEQLEKTFKTNIFSYFYLTKFATPHLKEGSSIINTASVTAYKGNPALMDYASTKGAIIAFTRSLSQSLAEKKIRVNAVAPGPVWTPLIPASFPAEKVAKFGQDIPLGRPAQPVEISPCYVFLASKESVFITGQVLHPNGGTVVNS